MSWVLLSLRKSELKMQQSQYVARDLQISREQRQDARRYQLEQMLVRNNMRNEQNALYSDYKAKRDSINERIKALREQNTESLKNENSILGKQQQELGLSETDLRLKDIKAGDAIALSKLTLGELDTYNKNQDNYKKYNSYQTQIENNNSVIQYIDAYTSGSKTSTDLQNEIDNLRTELNSAKEDYEMDLGNVKTQGEDDMEMIENEANDVDTMHEEEKVEVETQLEAIKQELQTVSDAVTQYIQSEGIKL